MRFSLRTLLIAAMLGPPLLAAGYFLLTEPRGIWMLKEILASLPFVGAVVFALLLLRLLSRASRFPLE